VTCLRHPHARYYRGHCAVCLLEEALAPGGASAAQLSDPTPQAALNDFTIQVPLGDSPSASVFLVKNNGPALRLLRLKTWKTPAPDGFLARFYELQARLEDWADRDIDPPLAAGVDAFGRPSVLTPFRQGVPILDGVRSGRLRSEDALARLTPLVALTRRAHARGLVHGSIVAGNVIVQSRSATACLLDFGFAPLFLPRGSDGALASEDLAGFAALGDTLRELAGKRSL
jgi:serine/threonine protein kinase